MPYTVDSDFIEQALESSIGQRPTVKRVERIGGGCINHGMKVESSAGVFFMKWQTGIADDMFEKEARGLQLLARTKSIKIPEVHGFGQIGARYFLVMEYVESRSEVKDYWEDLGESLAQMHYENTSKVYGLDHDNYIGKLDQPNSWRDDWVDFFIENRLEFQLRLAIGNGLVGDNLARRYRALYNKLHELLPVDQPALLHGDMWSGNVMTGADGKACLIDPTVYYGHREIELAFTRMFGGFDRKFYEAYQAAWPMEPGYHERFDIYNIYPHMTHTNLFGPSYLHGVENVLRRYV